MVTDQQVDHYQTFGFLVLPGYLDEQETAELAAELDRALGDGYGAHLVDRENWWGHSLPMMSRQRTPTSLALVEDDRFLGAARRLLAAQVLPTYAEGNLLFGEAGFHTDCGTGTPGVKFVAYLEPLTAASGALRLRLQETSLAASSPTATSPMTTTPTPATTSTGWAPIRRIHSGRPSPSGCVSWTCSGSPTAGDRHAVPALWQSAWQSTSQHQTGLRRSGWIWHLT
jgi:hypothetical protein